jgi:hypothetical protein
VRERGRLGNEKAFPTRNPAPMKCRSNSAMTRNCQTSAVRFALDDYPRSDMIPPKFGLNHRKICLDPDT